MLKTRAKPLGISIVVGKHEAFDFSENVFAKLVQKNISKSYVTLHVGAGTFKPVKATTMAEHEMHAEYIDVDITTIENIKKNIGKIAVVGTTSLRTIESLYWFGVKVFNDKNVAELSLLQWDVYEDELRGSKFSAIEALISSSFIISFLRVLSTLSEIYLLSSSIFLSTSAATGFSAGLSASGSATSLWEKVLRHCVSGGAVSGFPSGAGFGGGMLRKSRRGPISSSTGGSSFWPAE